MAPQPSRIATSVAWAELRGREKGLRGSSSAWLAIWVLATGYRWMKKLASPEPVVVRETLGPGEQLVITHHEQGAVLEPLPEVARKRRRRRRARTAPTD